MTAFTRIIIVMSILRQALGTQQTPPNQILVAISLFLTFFVMAPTFNKIYSDLDIFYSFYILDGRLYSQEQMANWRLQIWQDVIEDSINDKTYFYGLGYQDIIPAMEDPNRQGWDGKNEKGNVMPAGIYFIHLIDDNRTVSIKKVLYLK